MIERNSRCGVIVRSRSLWPVSRPIPFTSSMDKARANAVRILVRCAVDNAVSSLLAWKPQLGGCRCRLSIPGISRRPLEFLVENRS